MDYVDNNNCPSTWKPSDEQMKALDWTLSFANNCGEECLSDLRTLYEQLKKLRISPELKESDDERVRKAIICGMNRLKRINKETFAFIPIDDCITWLEKQGESDETKAKMFLMNKGYPIDANGTFPTYDEIYNIIRDGIEKQGEKNTAKPKFHEGDWIVHNVANFVFQIVGVGTYGYNVVNREGYAKTISLSNEENYHLWNIKDAKDGDMLVDSYNNIGIFKNCVGICWHSYVYLGCHGEILGFNIGGSHEQTDTYPATKEQRDTLMKAMADAGYTFDFEKQSEQEEPQVYETEDGEVITYSETKVDKKIIDNIKPTPKVGDWIVFNDHHNSIYQIEKIDRYYCLRHYLGGLMSIPIDSKLIKPWTIEDAEDGDILYSLTYNLIWIYKDKDNYHAAVDLNHNNVLSVNCDIFIPFDVCPANKMQRNILLQKIKEYGYYWDANKKELIIGGINYDTI